MAETQVFGEAPVFVIAFEKRGVILMRHQRGVGEVAEELWGWRGWRMEGMEDGGDGDAKEKRWLGQPCLGASMLLAHQYSWRTNVLAHQCVLAL